jgi:hypothetical protein
MLVLLDYGHSFFLSYSYFSVDIQYTKYADLLSVGYVYVKEAYNLPIVPKNSTLAPIPGAASNTRPLPVLKEGWFKYVKYDI